MKTSRLMTLVAVAAATLLIRTHASATILKYDLTGADETGPQHAVIFLDTAAIPDQIDDYPLAHDFQYFGVQGTYSNSSGSGTTTFTAAFFSAFNGGGLDLYSTAYNPETGWESTDLFFSSTDIVSTNPQAQLYSGPVTNATLLTGTFQLKDWFSFDGGELHTWTLNVTAVPEPTTTAAMSLGAAGLGVAVLRRRRRAGQLSV